MADMEANNVINMTPVPDHLYIREQAIGSIKGYRYVHDSVVVKLDEVNNEIEGKNNERRNAIGDDDTV